MTNTGVLEQLRDKMPYVMVGVLGIACIIILIYGIYISIKKKDKKVLLISIVYFVDIIFAGFLMFPITIIIQMDAGEHLSMEQGVNLLVAIVGIVVFNILAYMKVQKMNSKQIMDEQGYPYIRIERIECADEELPFLEFTSEDDFEYSFRIGEIILVKMLDKEQIVGELTYVGEQELEIKDKIGTRIVVSYDNIREIEDIVDYNALVVGIPKTGRGRNLSRGLKTLNILKTINVSEPKYDFETWKEVQDAEVEYFTTGNAYTIIVN